MLWNAFSISKTSGDDAVHGSIGKGCGGTSKYQKTCKNYGFVKMSKMKMVFRLKSLSSTSLNTNYNWDTKGAPSTSTNL